MKKTLLLLTMCLMALSNAFGAVTWYLQEYFESGQIPATWTQEVVSTASEYWAIEPTDSAKFPATGNLSNYYAVFRNQTANRQGYITKLISPAIDFASAPNVNRPQLVFKHAQVGTFDLFDTLKVWYRQNATSPWMILQVFDNSIDVWREDTIALLGYTGAAAYQIAFEANENLGRGIVLDDVRVCNASECVAASNIQVTVPGTTTVTLAWAGDQSADTFEVVVSTIAIVDWDNYNSVFHGFSTDFEIQVGGLNPGTTYFVYVRSKCYDNETGWTEWAMNNVRTRPRIELPYTEELSSQMPEGWARATDMSSAKPTFSAATATASGMASYSVDSTHSMQFGSITAGYYAVAITPELNVPTLQGVQVDFWGYAGSYAANTMNSTIGRMYIGVMDDPEASASLVIVDSVEIKVASKHQHFNVPLDGYTGQGKYLAFIVSNPSRTAYFYIDHLKITQPQVFTPTDVRILNATPDGFDVQVNKHGATAWNLRVASASKYQHMNVMPTEFLLSQNNITADLYHVDTHLGDSIIMVYAQGVSGQNTSEWSFPTTLRIPARGTLPIHYEFEDAATLPIKSLDNEIHISNSNKTFPGLYFPLTDLSNYYPKAQTSTPKYENSNHMLLQGLNNWMTLPYLDSFAGQMVSFQLAAATEGQSRVAVGVMRDPYDLSTFTQLAVFDGPKSAYRRCEVDLDGKESLGHYVAIVAIRPTSLGTYGSINHIDALHVDSIPPCPEAIDVKAVVADTTITLTWPDRGANHWYVEVFNSTDTVLVASKDVTTPTATIGGLTTLTSYSYRVNTICGNDTLPGLGKVKFTTKCELITSFPWSEVFDSITATGTFAESCWENIHVAGSGTSRFSFSTTTNGSNGTKKIYITSMAVGTITRLILPEMILPNANYQFLISMYRNSTSNTKTTEGMRILVDQDGVETELAFIPRVVSVASGDIPAEDADEWYTYELPIGVSGNCRIIIQAESQNGAAMYLDNFIVRQIPSCQSVKKLTFSNVTASGATASWTPRGNESQWEYVLTAPGVTPEWSEAVRVSSPTVTLTGLNGSSSYDLHVRAYCSAQDQSEVVVGSFQTACGPIVAMPWGEGFEAFEIGANNSPAPNCWGLLNTNDGASSTSTTYPQVYVNNSAVYVKSGSKSLYFKSSKDRSAYAIFPEIGVPLNTLRMTFSHKEESETYAGILAVGYITDPTDASTFVELAQYTRLTKIWQEEEIILSNIPAAVASTARLAFRYGGGPNNNYFLGIDDITIYQLDLTCPGLTTLEAISESPSSITVSWTAAADMPVDVQVSDSANFADARTYSGVTGGSLVLGNLPENHYYYIRARQSCDTEGEWKSIVAKTLCEAVDPETYPVQDFEGPNDLDCWLVGVSMAGVQPTDNPTIGSTAARGKYLYFNKTATTNDSITRGDGLYAIMPMLNVDSVKDYEVAFKAFKTTDEATNAGVLSVGVITDPNDFSTFTSMTTISLDYALDTTMMKSYVVNVLDYTGDYNGEFGKYIMFLALSGDDANAIGLDNVEVRDVSLCPGIVEGQIRAIGSDTAIYRWEGTGAPAYEVVVLSEQVNPDLAESMPIVDTIVVADSVILRGLNPGMRHFAYVRAICTAEEQSRWSSFTAFRTECGATWLPFVEKLDDAGALECWTVGNVQSTNSTYIPSLQTTSTYLYNSARTLRLYAYNASSTHADSSYAIMPQMDFGPKGIQGHTLMLYARSYGTTTSYYKHLLVGVVNDSIDSFQLIQDIELGDAYAPYEISFEAYTGEGGRIALMAVKDPSTSATATCYSYVYADDFTVFETPTCKSLAAIDVEPGRRTIDVVLTPKPETSLDHYEIVWSTERMNDLALELAPKTDVDTTGKYTITGLDRETLYYIYARVNCGLEDGVSEWLGTSITTKGLYGCDDLQAVGSGSTTNTSLPAHSLYNYTLSEQIYTPAEIGRAGRIGSVAFYNTGTTKTRKWDVYLLHTTKESFTTTTDWVNVTDADKVYSGELEVLSGQWNTLLFDRVFTYNGTDNLLLVLHDHTGSYSSGISHLVFTGAANQAIYKYQDAVGIDPHNMTIAASSRVATKNQLQLGFCYELDACPSITDLSSELLGTGISEAMLRWTTADADYLSGYDVIVSDSVVAQPDSVVPTYANVQGDSVHITGLQPETLYHVYVRAICRAEGHDEGVSTWVDTTFETLADCPAVVNLASEQTAATTVKVTWERALEEQALNFAYVCSTDSLGKAELAVAEKTYVNDTLAVEISNLAYDQEYHIYVASVCGHSFSPWTKTKIKTEAACAPATNLRIGRLAHNLIVLEWNRSRFGSETQWEAGIVGDPASVVIVNDTAETKSAMLIGLVPDSAYTAYVRCICGDGEVSEMALLPFRSDKSNLKSCVTIGEGTTNGYYMPYNTFYKNTWTQQIYTAEEIGQAGRILSIWYHCAAVAALEDQVKFYMAHTTKEVAETTSDWVPQADLVEVYADQHHTHPTDTGWVEIQLTTPFEYNGTDNLAVVVSKHATEYSNAVKYYYSTGTSGVCMYRSSDSDATYGEYPGTSTGTRNTYKANIQFCFSTNIDCPSVVKLAAAEVGTSSAVITWEPAGSERAWETYLADTLIADFTGLVLDTVHSCTQALANLLDDHHYLYYVRPICGGEWNAVEFTTLANCPAPISLNVDSLTDTAAKISWARLLEVGSNCQVAYGLADTFNLADPNTYTLKVATMDYVVLDGLTAQTEYSAAVRSLCDADGQSRWSEIITFKTPCSITPLPWREGFEDYSIGTYNSPMIDCWDALNINEGTSTTYPQAYVNNSTAYVRSGSQSLYFKSSNSRYAYVIMPPFEAPLNRLQISFSYKDESATSSGYLELGYMTNVDNDSSFVLLAQYPRSTAWQDLQEVPLDSVPAEVASTARLAFRYGGGPNNNYYLGLDDILVEVVPTCPGPLSVTVLETAADSATFTWVPKGRETQWQYLCIPDGAVPDWTNAPLVNTTSATVHGLSAATPYAVYVRSYCSAEDQSEARLTLFSTECGVVTALPWKESFETYKAGTYSSTADSIVPPCWEMIKTGAATNYPHVAVGSSYAFPHSGNNVLVTYTTDSCFAILPAFAPALNTLQVSFYYRTYNTGNCGNLILGYFTSTDTLFHEIATYGPVASIRKEKELLNNLPASATRLAFLYTGGTSNMYNVSLDDILVEELNMSCPGVKNVAVVEPRMNQATVQWTYRGTGSLNAEVQVASDSRFDNIIDSAVVMNASEYLAVGMTAATKYYVRVRQVCGDGEFSEWSETEIFYTSYGLPFAPQFTSTTIPSDWTRSNTEAARVFAGEKMVPYSGGWTIVAADTVIDQYHLRAALSGTTYHYWMLTPTIDLTQSVGEGLVLDFDAGLVATTAANEAKMYTGDDDRFLVAVSTDGGKTWNPANVTEWNNTGTGDYVYNDVPTHGKSYKINMTDYAGKVVQIGFYGESSVTNAVNYFKVGKIRVGTMVTVNYLDTICEGNSFNKNGFSIPYEDLPVGLNTFSRFETVDTTLQLLLQQVLVSQASFSEISVTLCEGEHFNDYGFDFTVTESGTQIRRLDNGNRFGCDSTVTLQVTMNPILRTELIVGCNEESYTWHGKTYYQSTIVDDTTSSVVTGCDSITTLHLTFCAGEHYRYHNAFCQGGSYSDEFFENLTAPGEYKGSRTDMIGCVTNAELTLHQLAPGQNYVDSVHVSKLPYVLGNDTLCPETDQPGYVYHGSADFGCGLVNVTIYVYDKVALDNIAAGTLQVAPNPVRIGEDIRILTSIGFTSDYSCRVFDAVGKLVYESFEPATTIPGLPVAGAYTIRISAGNTTYQGKLIVK
ncbi:MAG: choice-of-anchor J domain-containing protein, partial [Paludibacteraceae bacterium]|nr:choice-of-anchor J domain-containing protein [Paludibacteraceae bacterium]